MRKRLLTGLLAVGVLVGLLPGVVSAAPPGARQDGSPRIERTISCDVGQGVNVTVIVEAPSGVAQTRARDLLDQILDQDDRSCVPGTKEVSTIRVPGDSLVISITIIITV
jgi:hypothetical protein